MPIQIRVNISSQVLDKTEPLKYALNQRFIDKNEFFKRKAAAGLLAWTIMLSNPLKKLSMNIFVHAQI